MNVLRIAVNAGNSLGASGFQTNLAPAMTVGTGFFGRSSIAENVGPQHLIQWVKLAWNKEARIAMPSFDHAALPAMPRLGASPKGEIDYDFGNPPPGTAPEGDIRAEIRRIIVEELRGLGGRSGLGRRSGQ